LFQNERPKTAVELELEEKNRIIAELTEESVAQQITIKGLVKENKDQAEKITQLAEKITQLAEKNTQLAEKIERLEIANAQLSMTVKMIVAKIDSGKLCSDSFRFVLDKNNSSSQFIAENVKGDDNDSDSNKKAIDIADDGQLCHVAGDSTKGKEINTSELL
jgi:hypothetical protein